MALALSMWMKRSPLLFLIISIITFLTGLVLFSYRSSQVSYFYNGHTVTNEIFLVACDITGNCDLDRYYVLWPRSYYTVDGLRFDSRTNQKTLKKHHHFSRKSKVDWVDAHQSHHREASKPVSSVPAPSCVQTYEYH